MGLSSAGCRACLESYRRRVRRLVELLDPVGRRAARPAVAALFATLRARLDDDVRRRRSPRYRASMGLCERRWLGPTLQAVHDTLRRELRSPLTRRDATTLRACDAVLSESLQRIAPDADRCARH
jgi:hypothetical protein